MRLSTYGALPLEALHDLLSAAVKQLLSTNDISEFVALKKHIEILIALIEERKKEKSLPQLVKCH